MKRQFSMLAWAVALGLGLAAAGPIQSASADTPSDLNEPFWSLHPSPRALPDGLLNHYPGAGSHATPPRYHGPRHEAPRYHRPRYPAPRYHRPVNPGFFGFFGAPPYHYDPPVRAAPRYQHPRRGLSAAHVQWCFDRYRSYRVSDNTFQPYNGPRRQCRSPYG